MTRRYSFLWALVAVAVFLGGCDSTPPSESSEPPSEVTSSSVADTPEEVSDYITALEDLKAAFATGDYAGYISRYYATGSDMGPGISVGINQWDEKLTGVIANMSYNPENIIESGNRATVTVNLDVSAGNEIIPEGKQTVQLVFNAVDPVEEVEHTVYISRMMLNTDGRRSYSYNDSQNDATTFENQVYYVSSEMLNFENMPLASVILFMNSFEYGEYGSGAYTTEEVVAGAEKYLGIADYPLDEAVLWSAENVEEGQKQEQVDIDNGMYFIVPMGRNTPPTGVLILPEPTQGDLTCRVFVYNDDLLLEVDHAVDYNYTILYEEDGITQYAQLLSVAEVGEEPEQAE